MTIFRALSVNIYYCILPPLTHFLYTCAIIKQLSLFLHLSVRACISAHTVDLHMTRLLTYCCDARLHHPLRGFILFLSPPHDDTDSGILLLSEETFMLLLYLCVIVVLRPSIKPPVPLRCTYTKKHTNPTISSCLYLLFCSWYSLPLFKPHPGFTLHCWKWFGNCTTVYLAPIWCQVSCRGLAATMHLNNPPPPPSVSAFLAQIRLENCLERDGGGGPQSGLSALGLPIIWQSWK